MVWLGVGRHELRFVAGEMGVARRFVWLVEVAGAVGARSAAGPGEKVREEMAPALEHFLGSSEGLSPATVTRLTQQCLGLYVGAWGCSAG